MNNFTFSEIEYVRPDFKQVGDTWKKATEQIINADTYNG